MKVESGSCYITWGDCTFSIELGISFLDENGVLVFEKIFKGSATSTTGTSVTYQQNGVQRAYDAINEALTNFLTNINKDAEYRFFVDNRNFFRNKGEARFANPRDVIPEDVSNMLIAYAVRAGDSWLLDNLLNRGFSPNVVHGTDGMFLMHWAALYNKADIISRLASAGAKVNQRDNLGHLPIYYSAWNNNKEATERLLANNSETNIIDESDLLHSGELLDSFGDHFASLWKKDDAKSHYDLAFVTMQKAAQDYSSKSAKVSTEKSWRFISLVALSAFKGYAQDVNAKYQQKEWNQIAALRAANTTGISYYKALDYFEKHPTIKPSIQTQTGTPAPRIEKQTSTNPYIPTQPGIFAVRGDFADLNVEQESYDKLATLAKDKSSVIQNKLLALDSAKSYEEFNQLQKGKADE